MASNSVEWGGGVPLEELRTWARSPRARIEEHGVQTSLFAGHETRMVRVILGHQSAIITEQQARELGFQFGLDFGGGQ